MSLGFFSYPMPVNETVLSYAPGSAEAELLRSVLKKLKKEEADIRAKMDAQTKKEQG